RRFHRSHCLNRLRGCGTHRGSYCRSGYHSGVLFVDRDVLLLRVLTAITASATTAARTAVCVVGGGIARLRTLIALVVAFGGIAFYASMVAFSAHRALGTLILATVAALLRTAGAFGRLSRI